MSRHSRLLTRGWALRPAVTAVALLAASASTVVVANTSASAASCPISVARFGHDLAAAQKALASVTATCRTIFFSKGTYVFNDKFRIEVDSVNVTGQSGAVIKPAAGTKFKGGLIHTVDTTGVTVSGLKITGSPDKGIEAHRASKFTISNNGIRNSYTTGIHVLGSNSGTVSNNTVANNRSNGIDTHGATYVVIKGNKVYRNGGPRLETTEKNEGNGIIAFCSQHIDILSNTVYNNSQYQPGVRDAIRASDSQIDPNEMVTKYIKIDGNLVYDDQASGTQAYGIHIGGNKVVAGEGDIDFVTVTNNVGYGNLYAGIGTNGLAPNATFVQKNNRLKGRS